MNDVAAEDFWAFALERYARPGVSESCLELQDGDGSQVILLLFLCWCAVRGDELGALRHGAARDCAAGLESQLVAPLRAARRALTAAARALHDAELDAAGQRLREAELRSERRVALALAAHARPACDRDDPQLLARRMLEACLQGDGVPVQRARECAASLAQGVLGP